MGTYATRLPSGAMAAWATQGIGRSVGMPPVAGTLQRRRRFSGLLRWLVNRIVFPSGAHPAIRTPFGSHVSRFGAPPSAGITYTSRPPS